MSDANQQDKECSHSPPLKEVRMKKLFAVTAISLALSLFSSVCAVGVISAPNGAEIVLSFNPEHSTQATQNQLIFDLSKQIQTKTLKTQNQTPAFLIIPDLLPPSYRLTANQSTTGISANYLLSQSSLYPFSNALCFNFLFQWIEFRDYYGIKDYPASRVV